MDINSKINLYPYATGQSVNRRNRTERTPATLSVRKNSLKDDDSMSSDRSENSSEQEDALKITIDTMGVDQLPNTMPEQSRRGC